MGVTIHYRLRSSAPEPKQARALVARLRNHALTLPFEQVDEIIELTGSDCDFQQHDDRYPHRWLLIQPLPDAETVWPKAYEHRSLGQRPRTVGSPGLFG